MPIGTDPSFNFVCSLCSVAVTLATSLVSVYSIWLQFEGQQGDLALCVSVWPGKSSAMTHPERLWVGTVVRMSGSSPIMHWCSQGNRKKLIDTKIRKCQRKWYHKVRLYCPFCVGNPRSWTQSLLCVRMFSTSILLFFITHLLAFLSFIFPFCVVMIVIIAL